MSTLRAATWTLSRLSAALLATVLVLSSAAAALAQQRTGFQLREFKDEAGSHKYSLFVPTGYTPTKKWPVILYLHGAGERGTDGVLPTTIGIGPLVKLREANFPFIVVFPQHEDPHGRILNAWSPDEPAGKRALAILAQVEKDFSVDDKREILTGWSMGGFGAWQMAAAAPGRWLSVVPISGGGDPALAESLKTVPIWAFHGAKDRIVRPAESRKIVDAVKAAGGQPRYTEVPDGDHNVWTQVYDNDRLYAWMLSPHSDPQTLRAVTSRPQPRAGEPASPVPEAPFVPALDIPRAMYVRLGNEMLAALADSIPKVVPRDALSGRLNDISDYTSAEGYTFSVYMSGLYYNAQLVRAAVRAYRQDRLNVQLGLSNVQVTISGTSINGQSHSATAGPISVVIGHQRPVWLSFDVTPQVVGRKLKLKLVGVAFSIPNDNWYVSGPSGVSAHGFGLTREKVADGLVNGIYGKKATIEQQVTSVVPGLVAQMEEKLDVMQYTKSAAGGIWPLPVYQPRLRMWPGEVSTDEQGVTLVLGVTAAAVNPAHTPKQVRVAPPAGPAAAQVARSTKLHVGLAPQALGPLSEMLVEADVARIHVADTPSQALAQFADPKVLAEAIPELNRYGDRLRVSSELILAAPINIVDMPRPAGDVREKGQEPTAARGGDDAAADGIKLLSAATASDDPRRFAFDAPHVKILVSIRHDPGAPEWTPCAELEVALQQGARPRLIKPTALTRSVEIAMDVEPQLEAKARFVEGYQPQETTIDVEKLKALFAAGWGEYIRSGPPLQVDLPDIDLGFTRLRASDAGWLPPALYVVFGPPGVKITNSTDVPLTYETKGPYSGWGGPYTLKPGASHDYPIYYPLIIRSRVGAGYQMNTLPVGSHSELRRIAAAEPKLYQAREPAEIEAEREKARAAQAVKPEEPRSDSPKSESPK